MHRFMIGWVVVGVLMGSSGSGRADPDAARDRDAARHRRVRLALSVGGIGVGLLAAGSAFGLSAHYAWQRVVEDCGGTPDRCPEPALGNARFDRDAANRSAHRADVLFALGGAAVITGVVLYLTAPAAPATHQALHIEPALGGESVGVVISGVLP